MIPAAGKTPHTARTASAAVLRLLWWLRIVALAAQAAVIGVVHFGLGIALPLTPLGATLAALALWQIVAALRLRAGRDGGPVEVALALLVDVAAFTSILYFTGGPTNPFVSLYLVPISLAATSLPAVATWLVGAACGVGYSLLWLKHVPLPSVHTRFGGDFDLHLAGMWINFLIAAVLIALFVGRLAALVRRREAELAELREAALRDQQIVALGTLAAGTAHELSTPLATLALLVEELAETTQDEAQAAHLKTMMDEIDAIGGRLSAIVSGVGAERSAGARRVPLGDYLDGLLAQWSAAHPEIELSAALTLANPRQPIAAEATIDQAIRNVLDNAAHATTSNGRRRVAVTAAGTAERLSIAVADDGIGLDPRLKAEIGTSIASTKARGLGIGLLLSRAALQRFGGSLELEDRAGGGVEARIDLPLRELCVDAR